MNGLVEGIEFTSETKVDFKDEWGIPTLDMMWRTEERRSGERRKIGYSFYKKPMSSKWVMPYKSAQAMNGKMSSLSQDVFRTLANNNEFVTKQEKTEMLEKFADRLRISGYPVRDTNPLSYFRVRHFL